MTRKKDSKIPPVPAGHRSLAPYLCVRDAARAIGFYTRAFGAKELFRMPGPDGRISHAEIQIGDSVLMLADEKPEQGARSPEAYGGTPASVFLYVPDVDGVFAKAKAAGAKIEAPPADMFWGDRYGRLRDPYGHEWSVATHLENVSPEEMSARMTASARG
jgi:PhnB protein